MIIYSSTKSGFMEDITNGVLVEKIYKNFLEKIGRTGKSEIRSWDNSLSRMYMVINDSDIPDDLNIAIEYRIPSTSKRVDFIIAGKNKSNKVAVIIELKQWESAEKVIEKDGMVKTFLGGGERETIHPSYQALSYATLIEDFNEAVSHENIKLFPCAYLHNYIVQNPDPLLDEIYSDYVTQAPIFGRTDSTKLRDFIKSNIKSSDNSTLELINEGKLRPSKSLQESLLKMIQGNKEFVMIDEQKVIYEEILYLANKFQKTNKKQVLVVEGGPGTGKSVLAIQALVALINQDKMCHYVTKNLAPREVYASKLKGHMKRNSIDNLFKSSGIYHSLNANELDVVLVDEAHRLNEKSGIFSNLGENQTKELINAAKLAVFFIDERQRVHIKDAGSIADVEYYADYYDADFKKMKLKSQFRCNGSDGYLAFIDDLLQIRDTANYDGFDIDYEMLVIDNPNDLYDIILEKNINNKARILAGYCWDWDSSNRNNPDHYDIIIEEYAFKKSWNLGNTKTYILDEKSIEQVGCIHTSQGLELDYVGVIIGNDLRFENGKIITDYTKRAKTDQSLRGIKKLMKADPERALNLADEIIKNTYRVLLTRGQKGCYIYCEDKELEKYIKHRLNLIKNYKDNFVK